MPSCWRLVALTMPWVTRLRQPERIADREHHVADLQLVGAAEGRDRQRAEVDLQHRQIGVRVAADDVGVGHAAVRQLHRIESALAIT